MTLIAFDDTDSRDGMCTTYLMLKFIRSLGEIDDSLQVIGYPKLVRLNPNIPYKTRGNGALCVEVGYGVGEQISLGRWGSNELWMTWEADGTHLLTSEMEDLVMKLAVRVVKEFAMLDGDGTDPGIVMFSAPPPGSFFWKAVQSLVALDEAKAFIDENNGQYRTFNSGRGIIGAAAACSWKPGDRTYEIISYRHPSKFGTIRNVSYESIERMDNLLPTTFNNIDHTNHHPAIVPSSPCPVLHGIRGEESEDLLKAVRVIEGEEAAARLMFMTNQGSDDHLVRKEIRDIRPYESVMVQGVVGGTMGGRSDSLLSIRLSAVRSMRSEDLYEIRMNTKCSSRSEDRRSECQLGSKNLMRNESLLDFWSPLVARSDNLLSTRLSPLGSMRTQEGIRNLPGGHVVFPIQDGTGTMDCIAYEPTKEFRDVVRQLLPGDEIIAVGGVRKEPFTVNLEKLNVVTLNETPLKRKVGNPMCKECGVRMKSIGTEQGYRCKRCGEKAGEGEAEFEEMEERDLLLGWYEVPVCARRHLAKPLKRMPIN